jgi:quaternary ammonium compound-resistance protein SugE
MPTFYDTHEAYRAWSTRSGKRCARRRIVAAKQIGVSSLMKNNASWMILVVAGLFEVAWAIGLKYSEGFSRVWPSIATAGAMIVSIVLLGIAMKNLPVGTAYAAWTGIGAIGTVLLGIVLFGDSASPSRLICVALIMAGIIGLKVVE